MYKLKRKAAERYMTAGMGRAADDPLRLQAERFITTGEPREFYHGFASGLELAYRTYEASHGRPEEFAAALAALLSRASNLYLD